MGVCLLGVLWFFVFVSSSWAIRAVVRCQDLVEAALGPSPRIHLAIRAAAKTSESLEAESRFYTGIFFEVPLVDPAAERRLRQRRQERESLLESIARLKNTLKLLAFKEELLEYHRRRMLKALEDNAPFLELKEEILLLQNKQREIEARLKAYGIDPREAQRCLW